MGRLQIACERPGFLLLGLVLIPLVWLMSYRSLAGLGQLRRWTAIGLRTSIVLLLVLALAEVQMLRTSDQVTVLYLLDQSESIPVPKRQLMLRYVVDEVRQHRQADRDDQAGVIVFSQEASIEVPPLDDDLPSLRRPESLLTRTDATNLEAALKLAQASFPEGTAKRVVIVTDGNENIGDARSIAPLLAEQGVGIDVVPVRLEARAEVAVEKISLPADLRLGQPTEARVVLNNFSEPGKGRTVTGTLKILRSDGKLEELIGEQGRELHVEIPPGKTVIGVKHLVEKPGMYTYRAVFAPDDPQDDQLAQNNEATTFTHVRGKGRVLLIEDHDHRGEFDFMVERLRRQEIEIDVTPSNQLFTSLAQLQPYDCVILANVPRSGGDDASSVASFSDDQIQMLVRNTEQLGCGLIMIGGPNSFGAGGWVNTELEKAMPVDFKIENQKIQAVGALVLMMHASELAQGNYWQKIVARESIKSLGPMDYCGLLHWDDAGGNAWLWGGRQGLVRVGEQRNLMLAQLNRMQPGDMPQFDPAMKMALAAFNRVNASARHMIVISDGDPAPPLSTTVNRYVQAGIKISTVAIGTHGPAGSTPLQSLATATGGQYYVVTNPKALPKIYQREARRVAQPLVKDLENVSPEIIYPHEMLQGIDPPLPPLTGMVLTTVKQSPLVEVVLRSPVPGEPENATVLAAWTYGLGRAVALTTDAGHRWANAWTTWSNYDKFFSQMVRWAMRPVDEQERFAVATDVKEGMVRVIVTALDTASETPDYLNLNATAVGPDLGATSLELRKEATGRYVGQFPATRAGTYHITIDTGRGKAPLRAGASVPYPAEYRDRETNQPLLVSLAALRPRGGEPGKIIGSDLQPGELQDLLAVNTFRPGLPKAVSTRDVWPLVLLISACLFLADVFVRRVAITTDWFRPAWSWVRTRLFRSPAAPLVQERLERLRSRKAEIAQAIDQRRAAARFEPEVEPGPARTLDQVVGDVAAEGQRPSQPPDLGGWKPPGADEASYTSRLLEAKKKARIQQQPPREGGQPPSAQE